MDISSMLVGKSDQLDNTDLIGGPRDFTITGVTKGNAEQPLQIALAEFDRPWRPGITMRRLLAAIWGVDASAYVGRRVRLYRDDTVTFGAEKPGGTRLSHASHIDKRTTVTLPVSRGKFGKFTVEPLADVKAPAKLADNSQPVTPETLALLLAALEAADIPEAAWVSGAKRITGATVTRLEQLAEDDARSIIVELEARTKAGA